MATQLSKEIDRLAKEAGYPTQKLSHSTYIKILETAYKNCNSYQAVTAHTEGKEGFTGGNWQKHTVSAFNKIEIFTDTPNGQNSNGYIATIESYLYTVPGQAEANAALIAESKNMYAALKDALSDYESTWDADDPNSYTAKKVTELKEIINRINKH
jgi:hypothetical protein